MAIKLFVTGGTFDKEYNELDGTLYFKDSHINEMLLLGRSRLDISIRTLMLVETAKILASANVPKTIILTGAMIPYKFGSSDGLFNLGASLAYVQVLPNG